MIAPEVRIEDLEPDGFAHLNALMSRRDREPVSEIQVLHSGGRVLRVVDRRTGPLDALREPFTDPRAHAEALREHTGAARVTLIDRDLIGSLAAEVDALATPERTQPELLWTANERFWSHPAVVTSPAPPSSPWPAIAGRFAALGEAFTAVLGVWRGDDLFLSLVARVHNGAIVSVTSSPERPVRADAAAMLDDDVRLALLCDLEMFDHVCLAPDPAAALAERLPEAIAHRGIEEVLCLT